MKEHTVTIISTISYTYKVPARNSGEALAKAEDMRQLDLSEELASKRRFTDLVILDDDTVMVTSENGFMVY